MMNQKNILVKRLLLISKGKENAWKANEIAKVLGIRETHATCPNTRGIIRALIKSGMPIGSCAHGYFLIKDSDELFEYISELNQKAAKINDRMRNVMDAFTLSRSKG